MKRLTLTIPVILLLCFYAHAQSQVDLGETKDGTYTNRGFGFTFKYPKDWVVHGEATNERIKELGKERLEESGATPKASVEVAMKNTLYLLTVFHYPVGTPGITFNPAVLVMAEKVSHAPGIKNGKDYLLNLRTLLLKVGYQALVNEPTECQFGGTQFFRDDYASEINGVHLVNAHFATIKNGYAVVFIFVGADQPSLDEMTKSMETFHSELPLVRRGVTTVIGSEPKPTPKP